MRWVFRILGVLVVLVLIGMACMFALKLLEGPF